MIHTGVEFVTNFHWLISSPLFKMESFKYPVEKNWTAFSQSLFARAFSKPILQTRFWCGNLHWILIRFSIKSLHSLELRVSIPWSCRSIISERILSRSWKINRCMYLHLNYQPSQMIFWICVHQWDGRVYEKFFSKE